MTSKEALKIIKEIPLDEYEDYKNVGYFYEREIEILEKLVDKDTPLKPNDNLMKDYYHCSKCGREIPECVNKYFMRYCPNCGQKLKGDKEL